MKTIILDHPLIKHKLGILRDKNTSTKEFRELASELSMFLCYEATKDIETFKVEVETPLTKTIVERIDENKFAFLPILRAGISMVDGIIKVIPNAKIGHIGLYRNEETLEPIRYYYKVPKDINNRQVFILDPMLATGGSVCDAIKLIKEDGVKNIKVLSIISAPEGLEKIEQCHPDVQVYTAIVDSHLNDVGYIVPGLGDAGDRIFGTN